MLRPSPALVALALLPSCALDFQKYLELRNAPGADGGLDAPAPEDAGDAGGADTGATDAGADTGAVPALREAPFTLCDEAPRALGVRVLNAINGRVHVCAETAAGTAPLPATNPTYPGRTIAANAAPLGATAWVRFHLRVGVDSTTACTDRPADVVRSEVFPVAREGEYLLVVAEGAEGPVFRFARDATCAPAAGSGAMVRVFNALPTELEVGVAPTNEAPRQVLWPALPVTEYGLGGDTERGYRRVDAAYRTMAMRLVGRSTEYRNNNELNLRDRTGYQMVYVRDTRVSTGYELLRCENVRMSTTYVTCYTTLLYSRSP